MIIVKHLTEFYHICLKILVYLTDFSPQFMACMLSIHAINCGLKFVRIAVYVSGISLTSKASVV